MTTQKLNALWYAQPPTRWADKPQWMSVSRLLEVEICPRRWSLNNASYPDIWEQYGYPQKPYLTTIAGQVVHFSLELIINALSKAGCTSVRNADFVGVLRQLGGFTRIIEESINQVFNKLHDNLRVEHNNDFLLKKIRDIKPELRERLQFLVSKLGLHDNLKTESARGKRLSSARVPLSKGSHSEVELRVEPLHWRGFVDNLILSDSTCEIADFKTGKYKPEHELQIRAYNWLWVRDSELNPTVRSVDKLTLSYPTGDIQVEALKPLELDEFERDLMERSQIAINAVQQIPPPAKPSLQNCSFCTVRHMCQPYWEPETQQALRQEAVKESSLRDKMIDLEVDILEQQSPSSWSVKIIVCSALPPLSKAMIYIPEMNLVLQQVLQSGSRIRIIDAYLIDKIEDDVQFPLITLHKMSEAFIV